MHLHKLHVGPVRKQRADTDLRAKLLPVEPAGTEVPALDEHHEVWIPTFTIAPATSPTPSTTIVRGITRGTPISLSIRYNGIGRLNDAAGAQPSMGSQRNLAQVLAVRQPCRDAAGSIAGELSLAAIRVEQPQEIITTRPPSWCPIEKLNPIGADAGVPGAQPPRQRSVRPPGYRLIKNQEIIATGMGLHKREHLTLNPPLSRGTK